MKPLDNLLEIIDEITTGNYSNDIMELTAEHQPKTVRRVAEAMGLMMVKIEAREYRLEMLVEELKALNETIRLNTINVISSLANALAARDTYTEGHTARVSELAVKLAKEMGVDDRDADCIKSL
ncbi:MAG: hypothetical protein GY729_17065 [Desulfobacteraceae bacterium]|nr:hypothetical protein [Desulfobacteraceae bacterium]